MTEETPRHLYLVDGSAYIFRAFFALPPMTRSDGTPTNAVFGVSSMLLNLFEQTDADFVAVIFDAKRKNFRNDIYPDYKGHRPDAPEELVPQFPLIHEAVEALSLPCISMEGFEADDLIATYARQARAQGSEVTIVSSDKDLMQLIDDGISMWDPMKNKTIGEAEVLEKFGVAPNRVIDVQALAGDSTDNVPGVPGIGVKTAAQLINEYGDLDSLLAGAENIKQPKRRESLIENADMARISRQLVTLRDDVPVEIPLTSLKRDTFDPEKALVFLRKMEFKRLISRLDGDAGQASGGEEDTGKPGDDTAEYELVTDTDRLKAWIEDAYTAGDIAIDTETTGLDPMRAKLVGISMATAPGKACYIPLRHGTDGDSGDLLDAGAETPEQVSVDDAIALLKPLFESPGVLKIGHNLKYDLTVLAREGIAVAPIDDTMVLSFVLDAGLHGHGMDELAELHLGVQTIHFEDVAGKGKSQVTFDKVPLDKALDYAAEDADITLRLHRLLKPRLLQEKMVTFYETIERPLISVLSSMEQAGIAVDPLVLKNLSADFAKRLAELEETIHKQAGREFNVGSPKQLGDVLFGEMGLTGGKKTKSGGYSTDSSVLEPLALEHPVVRDVLDWRMLSKLRGTYTEALIEKTNPETKRVHTSYSMVGAQTGRLSSNDPNLQNIPIRTAEGRKIRDAFISTPGHKLLSLDYSQIELRLVAEIADIGALKQAFRDGQDIHAMTASEVFGVPLDEMDPETRRKAKAINFGIIYGISAFGLANQIGVSRSDAKDFIDAYFDKFPGIKKFMDDTIESCRKTGYVETLFGRKIHMNSINDKNPMRRGGAERAAINAPIQGSAADIIKRAMNRIPAALEKADLTDSRMLLQIHDELIFECPDDLVEKTRDVVKEVMEGAASPARTLSTPLVVDAGIGTTWNAAH